MLDNETVEKTKNTAELYFKGVTGKRPFDLWKSFDKNLAKELSLFITGRMYAREKIPHKTRQLSDTKKGRPQDIFTFTIYS